MSFCCFLSLHNSEMSESYDNNDNPLSHFRLISNNDDRMECVG